MQAELEEVLSRRQAAAAHLQSLQGEIADLDREIDGIKAERAEAMRLAAQEAQVAPGPPSMATDQHGGDVMAGKGDLQDQFIAMALGMQQIPGVRAMLQEASNAGLVIPGFRQGGPPVFPASQKRAAAMTPPRGGYSDMEVTDEEDCHEAAPRSAAATSSQLAVAQAQRLIAQGPGVVQTAPNAVGKVAYGGTPVVIPPSRPAGPPPQDREAGTKGARIRRAQSGPYGARELQRRSQEAIALHDASYRMKLAHEAAANSVVQEVTQVELSHGACGSRQAPPPSNPTLEETPKVEEVASTPTVAPAEGSCGSTAAAAAAVVAAPRGGAESNPTEMVTGTPAQWTDVGNEGYHSSDDGSRADGMECG